MADGNNSMMEENMSPPVLDLIEKQGSEALKVPLQKEPAVQDTFLPIKNI